MNVNLRRRIDSQTIQKAIVEAEIVIQELDESQQLVNPHDDLSSERKWGSSFLPGVSAASTMELDLSKPLWERFSFLQTVADIYQVESIAFSPSGKIAAVGNLGDSTVTVFSVDGSTGQFTNIQTIASGKGVMSLAFSPSEKIAATANFANGSLTVYAIING